jgi:hypothetical protein
MPARTPPRRGLGISVCSPAYHLVELEQVTTKRLRLHCHSAPRPGLMNERGRAAAIERPATVKTSAMTPSVLDLRQMKSISIAPGLDVQSVHLAGRSFMRSDKSPQAAAASRRRVNHGTVVGAPMAPGIILVAALPSTIGAMGIGVRGNTTTFQNAADRECVGGVSWTAESKRDRKNSDAPTQHKPRIHNMLPGGVRYSGCPETVAPG